MFNRREFLRLAGQTLFMSSIPASASDFFRKGLLFGEAVPRQEIRFKKFRLKMKRVWTISRGSMDVKEIVLLELEKDGIVGRGEAAPTSRYGETADSVMGFLEKVSPIMRESNISRPGELSAKLRNVTVGDNAAKAALDMAILDWNAKQAGIPLFRYLGLKAGKAALTSFSIGIDKPDVIKEKVLEAVDFPLLKIKVGFPGDEEIIKAVRSVTDRPIRVDANEGWKTREEALEKINWLAARGVEFVEQPMPMEMIEDIKWVRRRSRIPLIADEGIISSKEIASAAGAYDGINIKLMKCGGIYEALRMITLSRKLRLKVMLGCMIETSLAITAAAHLTPLADYADLDGNLLISNDPFSDGVSVEKGRLLLPRRPGIGVRLRNGNAF